jgi:hypothetical protein
LRHGWRRDGWRHGEPGRQRRDGLDCLRQSEVEHFHRAVGPQLDVGRLEIAMDDALFVRRFKRERDLLSDAKGLGQV